MEEDPLLVDKKNNVAQLEKSFDFVKEGLISINTSEEDINYLGNIFNEIFAANNSSRNGLTMLNGAMYALGTRQKENLEWREHCAGSLRELIHECRGTGNISRWFCNTYKENNNNFPNSKTASKEYSKIDAFYNYFSEIHHHNSVHILQKLQSLYGSKIKVGDDSEKMFVKVVKDFVETLLNFFHENIKNI